MEKNVKFPPDDLHGPTSSRDKMLEEQKERGLGGRRRSDGEADP